MKPLVCLFLLSAGAFAETLHIYTWADYVSPEVVEKFEKNHGCKVVVDTFDSNESMYAKLKAGATGYDLVFPTAYMIQVMNAQGMLAKLDHTKIPNLPNIDPAVLAKVTDKTMEHSVPYTFAYAAIAVRKDKIKDAEASWAMFDRPALAGRVTLLDDMRESIGAALKSLGHSINTRDEAQLAAARDVLIRWKKNIARFDNEGYKAGIDSSEFLLVHGYSGDLFQVQMENPKVEILIPREGVTIGCDEMVIPKAAKQGELAHAFINFVLDPAIAAENMEWMGYYCPNKPALDKVSPDFLKNPAITIPADVEAKCEVIEDLGPDIAKYTKVWDEVKAAR
ncbi:MAG: spermidine/putrescine ABC transporter substrate-binding protein [Prosthecobacter sp.]|jgi:spermidine/putrescine transport system substrate-binding protein|uniref:polyamine ABC transporter substrate-binding protein n=1 Tax=Prosthecobacter sp. TaxID=1965333 RepID=UPI001A074B3B|nr:spermidine/putrescine ABC transporter substrate-binding protein [Prosthecobacter sp.]MBE2284077.1 spermidine/putrescine ABC transporter substrate-binding protein [Prosthecobacter sp.]